MAFPLPPGPQGLWSPHVWRGKEKGTQPGLYTLSLLTFCGENQPDGPPGSVARHANMSPIPDGSSSPGLEHVPLEDSPGLCRKSELTGPPGGAQAGAHQLWGQHGGSGQTPPLSQPCPTASQRSPGGPVPQPPAVSVASRVTLVSKAPVRIHVWTRRGPAARMVPLTGRGAALGAAVPSVLCPLWQSGAHGVPSGASAPSGVSLCVWQVPCVLSAPGRGALARSTGQGGARPRSTGTVWSKSSQAPAGTGVRPADTAGALETLGVRPWRFCLR